MPEYVVILSLLGLSLGSFVTSCTYRIPRKISILTLRSFCPHCNRKLKWYELIPLFGFIISAGRCKSCQKKISILYPITELVVAGITVYIFLEYGITWLALEFLFFFLISFTIAIIDWKFLIIPNQIFVAGLAAGVIFNCIKGTEELVFSLISSAGAFSTLFATMLIGNTLFKKQTMGMGDVKLAGVIGLFLGYHNFLISLWISAIIGSIYGIIMKHKGIKIENVGLNTDIKISFGAIFSIISFIVIMFQHHIKEILGI